MCDGINEGSIGQRPLSASPDKRETQVGKQLAHLDRAVNAAVGTQEKVALCLSGVLRPGIGCAEKEACPPQEQIVELAEIIRLAANKINNISSEYRNMLERVEL